MKMTNPEEETPRKFLLTFRTEGYRRKRIYATCTEAELQGEKERWAMLLEEQTGHGSWICTEVQDVTGKTVRTIGKEVVD